MGSSESKIAVEPKEASTPKPDPTQIQRLRNERVNRPLDPRSPSTNIDRTPIQIGGSVIRTSIEDRVCTLSTSDPRSPSVVFTRTPIKGTVGSLARRLGMLFLGDSLPSKPSAPSNLKVEEVEVLGDGEQGSSEALLTSQATRTDDSSSPVLPSLQSVCSDTPLVQSHLVHLADAEADAEMEADFTYEEAEEARESPLHKRLSMSLITCLEGTVPAQVFADVHHAYPPSPLSYADTKSHTDGPEHSYALPSITFDLMSHVTPSQHTVVVVANVTQGPEELVEAEHVEVAPVEAEHVEVAPVEAEHVDVAPVEAEHVEVAPVEAEPVDVAPVEAEPVEVAPVEADPVEVVPVEAEPVGVVLVEAEPVEVASVEAEPVEVVSVEAEPVEVVSVEAEPVEVTSVEAEPIEGTQASSPSPGLTLQPQTGIRCPVFDAKSPSQVVFKPQWLGKGFGTAGVRARGRGGKGASSSSPLSVRVATKKAANENRASSKQKQRGKTLAEGRSPLQILKATNSPRDHHSQTKLKVSTPDRQRPSHLDRRVLTTTMTMDKENR
ncbi:cell division cycle-associated protein 3 [Hypomesus transpacificus]|uniref:cell division cycle-associated protein 3 n=1 Tax=Hypomesus transpacificus TaxID=137520 RepID=UPI001F0743B1|nr:cell division cycle-associated protein 3 [Hypomesus transpacificus]